MDCSLRCWLFGDGVDAFFSGQIRYMFAVPSDREVAGNNAVVWTCTVFGAVEGEFVAADHDLVARFHDLNALHRPGPSPSHADDADRQTQMT